MIDFDASRFSQPLIDWFQQHQEDLPWRRNREPYAVWVSEIMLQQTQVATVIPYYQRFMARFPDVKTLAAASLDEVLKQWEGLGYYSRARNLHKAAQMVVADRGGALPQSPAELQKLPGIGRYTAGAIACFAFGLDVPVVDGNIVRVLARLFNIEDELDAAQRKGLWELAGQLVPQGRGAAWNEGLMELGRRICTPRAPDCAVCPLAEFCVAYALGLQEQRPIIKPKGQTPHYDVTAGVIRREDGRLLIAQRPVDGMLGGLWEFPGGKREDGESLEACLRREVQEELEIQIKVGDPLTEVKHAYTHFKITLYAFTCEYIGGDPQAIGCDAWAWATLDELDDYAFPVTDQKIIAALRKS